MDTGPRLDLAALSAKKNKGRATRALDAMDGHHAADSSPSISMLAVDTTRLQLISPPPEEFLRRSVMRSTPLRASEDMETPKESKRKRVQQRVTAPSATQVASSSSVSVPSTSRTTSVPLLEETPNPRAKKQVRRSLPPPEEEDDEDVHMESPTKPRFTMDKGKGRMIHEDDMDVVMSSGMMPRRIMDSTPRESGGPRRIVDSAPRRTLDSNGGARRMTMNATPLALPSMTPSRKFASEAKSRDAARRKVLGLVSAEEESEMNRRLFETPAATTVRRRELLQEEEDVFTPRKTREARREKENKTPGLGVALKTPAPSTSSRTPATTKPTRTPSTYKTSRTPGSPKSTPKRRKSFSLETTSTAEAALVVLAEERGEDVPPLKDLPTVQLTEEDRVRERRRSRSGSMGGRRSSVGDRSGRTSEVGSRSSLSRSRSRGRKSHQPAGPVLPPLSPPFSRVLGSSEADEGYYDWTHHKTAPFNTSEEEAQEESMMGDEREFEGVERVPMLDFDAVLRDGEDGGDWSETDDEDEWDLIQGGAKQGGVEAIGEYTGRFRTLRVRTKADPPSKATLERMEKWGRPVSPFPEEGRSFAGSQEAGLEAMGLPVQDTPTHEELQRPAVGRYDDEQLEEFAEDEQEVEEEQQPRRSEDSEDEEEVVRLSMGLGEEDEEQEGTVRHHHSGSEEEEDEGMIENRIPDDLPPSSPPSMASSSPLKLHQEDEEMEYSSEDHERYESESPLKRKSGGYSSSPYRHEETFYDTVVPMPQEPGSEVQDLDEEEDVDSQEEEDDEPAMYEEDEQEDGPAIQEDADEENDDDDSTDLEADMSMVKIVSADPRAAARAAAILKQHDYECFTKGALKRRNSLNDSRRHSVGGMVHDSRRRSLLESGIGKTKYKNRRRSTLGMGVIGDRVIIPGSPDITLPELLERAEREVVESPMSRQRPQMFLMDTPASPLRGALTVEEDVNPFYIPDVARSLFPPTAAVPVPSPVASPVRGPEEAASGEPRKWTKDEWKLLDGCFTDERMELGGGEEMAPVDAVQLENVVQRFVSLVGGQNVVDGYGDSWTRDSLLQRTRALQQKQRSGKVAPPLTPRNPLSPAPPPPPTQPSPSAKVLGGRNRRPSMEVPDFTPLGRRAPPPRTLRPSLPKPVTEDAPFSNLPPAKEKKSRVPPTLLAPRYSHLLDEAMVVSNEVSSLAKNLKAGPSTTDKTVPSPSPEESDESTVVDVDESMAMEDTSIVEALPKPLPPPPQPAPTPSFGRRLSRMFFSYLPTLSRTTPAPSRKVPRPPAQPGLPLPPLEILQKPRPPVTTPVRPPEPKAPHPKELVELHPVMAPSKPSMIPRPKLQQPPRRLFVKLAHVPRQPPSTQLEEKQPVPDFRPRRSSGVSVKDLIKTFEDIGEKEREEREKEALSRPGSSLSMRSKSQLSKPFKPTWRP
ncbi:hypothetical protein BKA70DRAFT_1276401 [Coprinopsis sp. MPI-PUGE-AT-0042]|nr:hypothetical protein BKA70DRAFT_1276401 [Coprinopsis sp. MPI-PUGE-AT-0042]